MNDYRKEFEQAAQKEGFNVETDRDAPIYIYKDILVDLLWEGFQSCLVGVHYNDDHCIDSPIHAEHWRFGWRIAHELGLAKESV